MRRKVIPVSPEARPRSVCNRAPNHDWGRSPPHLRRECGPQRVSRWERNWPSEHRAEAAAVRLRPGRRCDLGGGDWRLRLPAGCRAVLGLDRRRSSSFRDCCSGVGTARGPGPDPGACRAVLTPSGAEASGDPGWPGRALREELGRPHGLVSSYAEVAGRLPSVLERSGEVAVPCGGAGAGAAECRRPMRQVGESRGAEI
ncbi:hypothetical protein NDU88_004897 [Pleurodeles waltl]|uniref:Uncharacterized protein n=1 Tax=Pleurodeles waltl TaxID=8319 RepID=A0AAV7WW31_PLEWA|nr:hypothetical protein NDU88_004897 [Pleurodeles waltl]